MPLEINIACYPNNEIRARLSPASVRRLDSEGRKKKSLKAPKIDSLTLESNSKPSTTQGFENSPQKNKPGFGSTPTPTKFGKHGRRTLLRAGGAIDKLGYPPKWGIFLTGTLPGSTDESFKAIAQWSAYLVHRLKAWIAKRVKSKIDFYVWELQKRGALHLHYYVLCPNPRARKYLLQGFKRQWIRLLQAVSRMSGVDLFAKSSEKTHSQNLQVVQAYAQPVKKSVAAYLSKYCGKKSGKGFGGARKTYCPTRWWAISRPLNQLLQRMTLKYSMCVTHVDGYRKYEDLISLLQRWSIRDYAYGDKVGLGLNRVLYYSTGEAEKVFDEVSKPNALTTVQDCDPSLEGRLADLYKMVRFLKKDRKLWNHFDLNMAADTRRAIEKLLDNPSLTGFEIYAIAAEFALLANYALIHCPKYQEETLNRVVIRSREVEAQFRNLVNLQGAITVRQMPKLRV